MLTNQFLSVMASAASAGNLTLILETYDLQANITLSLSVSGITGTETENQLAFKCFTQMNTILSQNNYSYPNVPPSGQDTTIQQYISFPDQPMYPSFALTRTDHVMCVSSQCDFSLLITTNTTGAKIVVSSDPALLTVTQARNLRLGLRANYEDMDGTPYTDDQLIQIIQAASSNLCSYLKTYVVATTYMYGEVTQGTKSVFTPKGPIIDFFPPVARRPNGIFTIMIGIIWGSYKSNFAVDKERNEIYYRYAQDFLFNLEPFDDGNEIMIPYIAGYKKIPPIIQASVVNVMNIIGIDEYDSLQGQSFKVTMHDKTEIYKQLALSLGSFFCL